MVLVFLSVSHDEWTATNAADMGVGGSNARTISLWMYVMSGKEVTLVSMAMEPEVVPMVVIIIGHFDHFGEAQLHKICPAVMLGS